jgi:hypothetical protein
MRRLHLKSMLQNYEQTLCNKEFHYELNGKIKINLTFYIEDFCHLVGLQHVYGKDKRYLGSSGYHLIMNDVVTIDSIMKHNEKGFNFIKSKLEHFDSMRQLLSNGKVVKFSADRVNPKTIIAADFLIYHDGKEVLLHLFMRRESDKTDNFAPVSFIVISVKDKNMNQYISRQEKKTVTNFQVVENRTDGVCQ